MKKELSELISQKIQNVKNGLYELDSITVNNELNVIFHTLIGSNFSNQLFLDTSMKLLLVLDDYREKVDLQLMKEKIIKTQFDKTYILYILDLMSSWLSHEYNHSIAFQKQNTSFHYSRKTQEVLDYIDKNFQHDISLNLIAENLEISAPYLSQFFKKEMKISITNYIKQLRLNKSKLLLKRSSMKIYEVAEAVGFNSCQYFSKVFYQNMQMTPIQYREIKQK